MLIPLVIRPGRAVAGGDFALRLRLGPARRVEGDLLCYDSYPPGGIRRNRDN